MEVNVDAKILLHKVKEIQQRIEKLAIAEDARWKPDGWKTKDTVLSHLRRISWCCYLAEDYVVRLDANDVLTLEGCERLLWASDVTQVTLPS